MVGYNVSRETSLVYKNELSMFHVKLINIIKKKDKVINLALVKKK